MHLALHSGACLPEVHTLLSPGLSLTVEPLGGYLVAFAGTHMEHSPVQDQFCVDKLLAILPAGCWAVAAIGCEKVLLGPFAARHRSCRPQLYDRLLGSFSQSPVSLPCKSKP